VLKREAQIRTIFGVNLWSRTKYLGNADHLSSTSAVIVQVVN